MCRRQLFVVKTLTLRQFLGCHKCQILHDSSTCYTPIVNYNESLCPSAHVSRFCAADNIFWTTEAFATKLRMMVYHHELGWYAESLVCCQAQGDCESSVNSSGVLPVGWLPVMADESIPPVKLMSENVPAWALTSFCLKSKAVSQGVATVAPNSFLGARVG